MQTDEITRIVAIGDSITKGDVLLNGIQGHENTTKGGWVTTITKRIRQNAAREFEVLNQGLNGDTSGGVLKRLARDVIAHRPDIVIVAIGTNDLYLEGINFKNIFRKKACVTPEVYRKNIEKIVEDITHYSAATNIIILGMPTPLKKYWDQSSRSNSITLPTQDILDERFFNANTLLQEMQALYAYDYVDLASVWPKTLAGSWALSSDGIHPNNAGYDVIAKHVYDALEKYIQV